MKRIVEHIDKEKVPREFSINDFDLFISKKSNIQGIALTNDLLFTNIRKIYSFRSRIENIINWNLGDFKLLKAPDNSIDRVFLEKYFQENMDNPFAIYFILNLIVNKVIVTEKNVVTQFPPLRQKPSKDICINEFERVKNKVMPGDSIFMFNRESNISRKIRYIDRSQWSHVADMFTNTMIQDLTTSGIQRYDISNLDPYQTDIAVYRQLDSMGKTDYSDWYSYCEETYNRNLKYNWYGILKAYIFRTFPKLLFIKSKFPPKDITLSDLINFNQLVLIDYV